jgi:hypothetical protein
MSRAPALALGVLACLPLWACGPTMPRGPAEAPGLMAEVITARPHKPDDPPPGECWDTDVIPAVIETVTEQTRLTDEVRDPDGQLVTPASYRSVSRLRMIQDRAQVWFRVPCPEDETDEFWASVQRALKARGYFTQGLTGANDPKTAEAVRRFQSERGLDSPILSLAAAQELGLVAVPRDQLR